MTRAYLSMPGDTPASIRTDLIHHISKNFLVDSDSVRSVSYWVKGTQYTTEKLDKSDVMFSYIPEFALHGDINAYLGKGQYSELQHCEYDNKPVVFVAFDVIKKKSTLYYCSNHKIHDSKDWKRKYGSVALAKILHLSFGKQGKRYTLQNNRRLLLLLD